jgi:tetratricopeptide (TPR) repeat protein
MANDFKERLTEARNAENSGTLPDAAAIYEGLLKDEPHNEKILNRLMIIYRKLKAYKKEIGIINKAIKLQQQYYKPSSKPKGIIAELSNKLNLSTGLQNKKGDGYIPEAILKLNKRKEVVEKKLS